MNLVRTITYEGRVVQPGATWALRLNSLGISGRLRCVTAEPPTYVAEVVLSGTVLLGTEPQSSPDQAERALHESIKQRVCALLGITPTSPANRPNDDAAKGGGSR